jgi:hypothetical protein
MITRERTETQAADAHHRSHGLLMRLRHLLVGLASPIDRKMSPLADTTGADRLDAPPVDWAGFTTMRITDVPACIHAFEAMHRRWVAQQARQREVRL